MPERESDQFYLDPDFILAAAKELDKSASKADQGMSRYLHEFVAQRESRLPLASLGMAAVQTDLVRPMTTDSAFEVRSADRPNFGPSNWGIQFLKKILADLRDVICGSKKKPAELGKNAQAYVAAITIIIMQKFHLSSPTANGLAVLIILAIGRATKKAFCEMTDAEFLAALMENR